MKNKGIGEKRENPQFWKGKENFCLMQKTMFIPRQSVEDCLNVSVAIPM